ncbi:LysE family translocator [Streptomyces sp. NPDC092952]|uniref:LysE family translocator n=1 Tax=Streptomyces sp. NPDC092952 TaxID=3366018 RepID=UPI00381616D2
MAMSTIGTALWSFALVVGLLTLTPGLDTALILRTSAVGRRRRAWGVVLGIQTGTLLWGALTSLGVTALLTASHLAYTALRWAGAVYLVWMGVRMLRDTFAPGGQGRSGAEAAESALLSGADTVGGGWRQGTLTNLLNPKMGAFYVAVLPQFIPAGVSHFTMGLLLTTVHILLGLVWSAVLIGFARVLRDWLRKPRARRLLDRITGTVIAGFGIRLALGD